MRRTRRLSAMDSILLPDPAPDRADLADLSGRRRESLLECGDEPVELDLPVVGGASEQRVTRVALGGHGLVC